MSQNKPLVSVCIPVYNNEDYIVETMNNILSQTYTNIELIIVDDNSGDSSLEKILTCADSAVQSGMADKKYDYSKKTIDYITDTDSNPAHSMPKIDFEKYGIKSPDDDAKTVYIYKNHENLGMSGNWNRCLSLCRGKYVKLICADDLIADDLIAREVGALEEHPEVLAVESDTEFKDPQGKSQGFYKRYKSTGVTDGKAIVRNSLFSRNKLGAPLANTFRRTAIEKLGGFDPIYHYIIDYDFFIKLALAGPVFIIHEPLNFFRIRNDSNTGEVLGGNQGKRYQAEHRKLVEKFQKELGLSDFQVNLSVFIRGVMNKLGGLYLKMHLK